MRLSVSNLIDLRMSSSPSYYSSGRSGLMRGNFGDYWRLEFRDPWFSQGVTFNEAISYDSSSIYWKWLARGAVCLLGLCLELSLCELLLFLLWLISTISIFTFDCQICLRWSLFFSLALDEPFPILLSPSRSKLLLLRLSQLSQVMLMMEEESLVLFRRGRTGLMRGYYGMGLSGVYSCGSFLVICSSVCYVFICLMLFQMISTSSLSSASSLRHLMELDRRMADLGVGVSLFLPSSCPCRLFYREDGSKQSSYALFWGYLNFIVSAYLSCSMRMGYFWTVLSCWANLWLLQLGREEREGSCLGEAAHGGICVWLWTKGDGMGQYG